MILQVFAVMDGAVRAFGNPMFFRSKGEALRSFADACQQEGSNFKKHAGDYTFVFLGEFDDGLGQFVNCAGGPQRVVSAMDYAEDVFPPEKRVS